MLHIQVIIALLSLITGITGLIGYDCGSVHTNITTLSLLDVGECEIPETYINITKQYVQLLQINDYSDTRVMQCKLEVHRTVYYCGMHSHVSIVSNGENEYVHEISQQTCQDLHTSGRFNFGNKQTLQGIRANHTTTFTLTFAGWLSSEGKCRGSPYADPFGSWESVVVQGTLKVTLTDYMAQVKLNSDNIHLRSGTVCSLSDSYCIDMEGGYTFWSIIPLDACKFNQYGVLYEGLSNKILDENVKIGPQTIYSLTTNEVTFALTARGKISVCGYTIIKTEHPKLFIFETTKGNTFAVKDKISISNLDIFVYMSSKFVYVEKYIRTQIKELYLDIVRQKCNLERQTHKNSSTIATQIPDEFAYDLMKGPGYMAVAAEEVVHIVKCVPVEIKIQEGESCYAELQVSRNNNTHFLTPRTHILKSQGTQIPCNKALPSYYYTGMDWYKILPAVTDANTPAILKPMTKITWIYRSPATSATDGIYSEKDLNELKDKIMFPMERPSLLNDIAREFKCKWRYTDETFE